MDVAHCLIARIEQNGLSRNGCQIGSHAALNTTVRNLSMRCITSAVLGKSGRHEFDARVSCDLQHTMQQRTNSAHSCAHAAAASTEPPSSELQAASPIEVKYLFNFHHHSWHEHGNFIHFESQHAVPFQR